ncbi:MFS transporter [Staphylococcus nepalensis]|uniref:MFS transporter n=1 Tax=Staphylococcus nepalensis TaxID=214473 RepID=A0ABS3L499_9STAP|nr:MFS transporter [Staphylococcus nepalensis]MBO1212181.1 MFS transporter [Staphylococcus nepalensis]MBO1217565.1 MFS transporter [Staphylococcus nepalensis]MBO1228378.1 MFS transporter [Staphylococcus nepalensis]MBO1235444.1 MFS transporter [Staphylococcus nepalensis]MBO1238668.1 MFS transporter [Staphylococcus nepalensis]
MSKEIERLIEDETSLRKFYKKVLTIVSISQIFGGAGLAAGITVGALIAKDILGTDAYSGLPSALFTLGSAGAAMMVGTLSQKFGRRIGLTIGFILGGVGAIGVIFAAVLNNIWLLFIALLIYGSGTATNLQARYAGTDLAKVNQRGKAISITMVMTTFGAVIGPNVADFMGNIALGINLPPLSGPFILAAFAYILAGLVLFIMLRPDPYLIAKRIHNSSNNTSSIDNTVNDKRGMVFGGFVMVLTQMVMLAIMTMTPVHMSHYGHTLSAIGIVIGLHIGFMYFPSLITGFLVDKVGAKIMSIISAITLLLAGLVSAFAPPNSVPLIALGLSLLGLGWNFGLISGTTMIVQSTSLDIRAKIQGKVDVFIALSGAAGGALSGVIVAQSNFMTLGIIGGLLSLIILPLLKFRHLSLRNEKY